MGVPAGSALQPQAAQSTDLAHAPLGQAVGGDGGSYAVLPGRLEDVAGGLEDPGRALLGALEGEALELVIDLDQAAGVHAVVGRIEDALRLERLLDARVGELVVGGTADDLRRGRSEEHTSELQSLMRRPFAVSC